MALSLEWLHRIERWLQAAKDSIYRPLGPIALEMITTTAKLSPEEAQAGVFEPVQPGQAWGAKWEYGWFRGSLVLPDEAKGRRIVAKLAPGGESLVWINNRVEGSIGWAHPEVLLARQAVPGARYNLLLESYAGHGVYECGYGPVLYGTESVPEPEPQQVKVGKSTFGIWREEVFQFWLDMTTLFELRSGLDPNSLRIAEVDKGLMDATCISDFELPEAEMLESVRAARERLRPLLECRNGSTAPELYAFGHAHLDVAWLWPLAETERKIARTAINQLALMEDYPEYRFLQSQPHLYWMLKRDYPELYERVKDAIRKGQWIPDGGMWVEADTNLAGGESLVRQVMAGRRFYREELGVDSRILWLPDVFGYSGALPQILRGCGMEGFATQKITWAYGGGDPFPYNSFWWEGIDGTAIAAHIFSDYNTETRPKSIFDRWNQRQQKNGVRRLIVSFGWGDGGGGPTREHTEFARRGEDLEGLPKIKQSSPAEFFQDLHKSGELTQRYVGELYFQAHRGTFTSQAKTKKGNRKSELALREAEFWGSAAAALNGFGFGPRTLEQDWRELMLNQFHDILPGSSIHRVYLEAEAGFQRIQEHAGEVAQTAAETFNRPGEGLTVFNSLPWERRVLVDLPEGQAEVTVPACGWTNVKSPAVVTSEEVRVTARLSDYGGAVLENELIRAQFNRLGELVSLMDKQSGLEWMAEPGNRFGMYKDVPDIFDAWDINSMTENIPVELGHEATLEIVWSGPLEARLRLTRRLHQSNLVQMIVLRRGSRRIEFRTGVDWQESHKLLKVHFPFSILSDEAIHEIQFGHLRRPAHRSRPFDADRFEVCNHKWTAITEEGRGAALLNDCKYGISTLGGSLNLTLLKSALAPDMTADKGPQTFTYAVMCWNGPFKTSGVVQEAYDLNTPALVLPGDGGRGQIFKLDRDNIVIEAVKPAEDASGDVIVRLYESMRTRTDCVLSTSLPVSAVEQTDLMEEPVGPLEMKAGKVRLEFRPFEIKTVRLKLK